MGGHPYWYFVPYQANLQRALDDLREREFLAGRYNPVIPFLRFPIPSHGPVAPGPQHRSIAEAFEAAGEDGTRSILDIQRISANPNYCAAAPFPEDILESAGLDGLPTRSEVEAALDELFESMDQRGQAFFLVAYDSGVPTEILFAGYSFD